VAVTTTPLGFKKPDGNEPARDGDNIMAANAQKAEDLLQGLSAQVASISTRTTSASTSTGCRSSRPAFLASPSKLTLMVSPTSSKENHDTANKQADGHRSDHPRPRSCPDHHARNARRNGT
jgi:hypothetical protein